MGFAVLRVTRVPWPGWLFYPRSGLVRFDDLPREIQACARGRQAINGRGRRSGRTVEDARQVGGGDADPAVPGNGDGDALVGPSVDRIDLTFAGPVVLAALVSRLFRAMQQVLVQPDRRQPAVRSPAGAGRGWRRCWFRSMQSASRWGQAHRWRSMTMLLAPMREMLEQVADEGGGAPGFVADGVDGLDAGVGGEILGRPGAAFAVEGDVGQRRLGVRVIRG